MKSDKIKPTKTFITLFEIILTGSREDSRKAAREVRKLLYSSSTGGRFDDIRLMIESAPEKYIDILEDWRKENFVIAVSVLYYLHSEEIQRDFLFPWLLHLLQHKNGNIRQSAVRMLENELGPLTVHIRYPKYEKSKIKSEQSDFILSNLYIALNNLLIDLWESKYEKYKYVNSLPTSPFKSIQMVLTRMEGDCGKEYIKQLKSRLSKMIF